jgi:hypothetical protein
MRKSTGTQPNRPFLPMSQYQHRSNAGKDKMKRRQLSAFQPDLFNLDDAPVPPFLGTTNPRCLRALSALLRGPVDREDLDRIVGCRNSPDLINRLKSLGLEIPCYRTQVRDLDGHLCRVGSYYLTPLDRMLIEQWIQRSGIKV